MSRVVWKSPIGAGRSVVQVPLGAEALSVGLDGEGYPAVWFACEPNVRGDLASLEVFLVPTGGTVPDDARFLGSFDLAAGIIAHGWVR